MDRQFNDLLGRFYYRNQCNTIIETGQTRLTSGLYRCCTSFVDLGSPSFRRHSFSLFDQAGAGSGGRSPSIRRRNEWSDFAGKGQFLKPRLKWAQFSDSRQRWNSARDNKREGKRCFHVNGLCSGQVGIRGPKISFSAELSRCAFTGNRIFGRDIREYKYDYNALGP